MGEKQRKSSSPRQVSCQHQGTGGSLPAPRPREDGTAGCSAVGSHLASLISCHFEMPLPFYSFFRGLALELPCLSLLELGRPLAWCGGPSCSSFSSVEVGRRVLAHRWAAVCGRHTPLSDPSACKITQGLTNHSAYHF